MPSPSVSSLLVEFRKSHHDDAMTEINEMIIAYNTSNVPGLGAGGGKGSDTVPDKQENSGMIIVDATYVPVIRRASIS